MPEIGGKSVNENSLVFIIKDANWEKGKFTGGASEIFSMLNMNNKSQLA